MLRNLNRYNLPAGADFPAGGKRRFHDHLASLDLLHSAADFKQDAEGRREQAIDVERRGEEAQGQVRIHLPALAAVLSSGGRTRTVAVDERGDQASVDEASDGRVVGPWFMDADGFLSIPVTFNLQQSTARAPD
jgi:hypothetical protein